MGYKCNLCISGKDVHNIQGLANVYLHVEAIGLRSLTRKRIIVQHAVCISNC